MKHSGAETEVHGRANWQSGGFALYVHWPYCLAKCPYCDFNSHVARSIDHSVWSKAYVDDIRSWGRLLPGRVLSSIYFGGGTPSLMQPETVARVIEAAKEAWSASNDLEITLEANPTSVELRRFEAFADAGVNRVSLGLQALDDDALRLLGRQHSVREGLQAWDVAKRVFSRCSFDLIYSRQFQDQFAWEAELRSALSLEPDHMSLYQLTVEDGTAFGDRYKIGKLPGLPDEDRGADMFLATQTLCEEAGLPAYEVSNHAKPGQESRHNLVYWRYGDYVGVGPGAHGRVQIGPARYATAAVRSPNSWLESRADCADLLQGCEVISPSDAADEYLMMSLRLSEGMDLARHSALGGSQLSGAALDGLRHQGLLWAQGDRIGATPQGRPLLNALIRALL